MFLLDTISEFILFTSPSGWFLTHLEYHRTTVHDVLMSDEEIFVFLPVQSHRLNVDIFGRLADGPDTELLITCQFQSTLIQSGEPMIYRPSAGLTG